MLQTIRLQVHRLARPMAALVTRRGFEIAFAAVAAIVSGRASAYTVVEYYNRALDHYFVTPLPDEVSALDSGRIAGWERTGLGFDAFATAAAGGLAVSPVCRFYIPPSHGDSHFLSASPGECASVRMKIGTDPNYSGYIEETSAEFYIAVPDGATGACPAGTSPVYRLWNQRADSNHRYTADRATRDAMIARGYAPEGYGPLGVAMCTPRAETGDSSVSVTGLSPFSPACDSAPVTGVLYTGAEVEPQVAADPANPLHLIGVWQQDRWSDGGARGLRTGYSFDGGLTWGVTHAAFSRCTGGSAAAGTDYARASDPWTSIGPDGIAYQVAIAFNGATFATGSSSAVLASRSTDGGKTWSTPATLILDLDTPFDDKESVTADPAAPGHAYAVWDRLESTGHGPAYFARTIDAGTTWETARPIYDPGGRNQTLNNQIVATSTTLFDFFTEFDVDISNRVTHHIALVRSDDRGVTFGAPIVVSDVRAVGTSDPQDASRTLRDAANLGSFAGGPDGTLVAAWQDARFSAGAHDGIAFSRSRDGGQTWSPPVQVNSAAAVPAFLPATTVRADGTIGVQYYDMRSDTADPATLLVDVWLATSKDGLTWSERHVAGPFDFNLAPIVEGGLFVGDYQGLASGNDAFISLAARTGLTLDNRTDIYATTFHPVAASTGASAKAATALPYRALPAAEAPMTPQWQARIDASVRRTLQQHHRGGNTPPAGAPPSVP